ncbi:pilus assembly PilX N-terminal domain-containing protein [Povalibacter sp.]|uniref:pilus assembly PilX N-terminal domain-containing protein n=1 Tax=Povalibacter sp. TaxID=1962978 RepID=UPI002F4213FF
MISHGGTGQSQRGAALVVGLLLLLVLTLLAISGMNTASLELVMAGNTQYGQNAFQAAEAGIGHSLQHGGFNPSAGIEGPTTVTVAEPDKYTTTITPQLGGAAQPAMWGSSWDAFSTYHFEIRSAGVSGRNAQATNFQGVAIISPADSTVTPTGSTTALN